ncbi:carbohydrate sulfotransferase [Elysia marginata]|uniref:Carbohydrate sulfotransferase n=1 Tax=Elysia marginata TaxID=1093978 RepID=A0AAV4IT76_9GAST|nr:carbohydrate sulfotransferase [Elysia marginata]
MGSFGQVTSLSRAKLGSVLKEPCCLQRLAKNRKSVLVVCLGLALVLCIVHLASYVVSRNVSPSPMFGKPSPQRLKPRLKILIVSYMRSGSTLCGNILQAHPGVFYVYEPLLYLWDHYVPGKDLSKNLPLRRRAKALWRESKPVIPPPLDFLSYMFHCNVSTYNLDFLTNVAHSKAFRESGCVKSVGGSNVMNVTLGCATGVKHRCQASSAVAQKVVRLTMAEGGRLLKRDPSIRLVHLVRDPRGVLLSRMRFNQKTKGEMHKNYTSICRRMLADMKDTVHLNKNHWGRILTVRYEDLAQDLLSITSKIYKFVGLEMLPSVRDFLAKMTATDARNVHGKIAGDTATKVPISCDNSLIDIKLLDSA